MDEDGTGVTSAASPRALNIGSDDPTAATVTSTGSGPSQATSPTAREAASPTTSHTTISSPKEAMYLEEIGRARAFLWFVILISVLMVSVIPLMGGDTVARWLHTSTAAFAGVVAVILQLIVRDETRYRSWMTPCFGFFAATGVATGFYFWGVNSGVLIVIPLGVYFFALGESFAGALAVHLYVTGSHAVLSALTIAEVLPDVSLVRPIDLSRPKLIAILISLQIVCMAAFVMARGLRRTSLATLEQLDRAVRDNAKREALLNEAKQELARAQHIGGEGRYSSQIVGSFKLGNVIGRGAMGEVYEAFHLETSEPAAVKLLGQDALLKPDLVARFLREVKIAASLKVENVVRVLEVSDPLDPLPYLVMERLQGETLADRLRREPALRAPEITRLIRELSRGIGAAHEAGIVHRDLKPSNVFCHQSGERRTWKVLDFGVSKLIDQSGTLTQGRIVGTPAYMAPEQARGEELDARADLYALGVIGYRVLTGRPAFSGNDLPAILRAVVYDTPPKPSEISSVNANFDRVLAIAMAKAPEDRFADANELWQAFEAAEQGSLSAELGERGAQLMEKHPWGVRDVV